MPSRHSARYNDEAARHSSGAATQRENGYFPRAGASQPSPIYPSYPHPEAPPGAGLWHAQTYPGGPPMQPNSYPSSGAFPASAHQYGQPFPQAPPGYPMPYANGHHYPPGSYRQYHSPEASADYSTPTGSRSSPDRTHIVECEIEEPEDADGEGVTPEAREVPRIEWYPHKSNCDEESVDGVHEGYPKSGSSNQGAEVEGFRQVAEDNIPKCNDRKHPLGKYDLAVANSNKWAVFQWEGLYLQQDYVKAGRGFIRLDNNPRACLSDWIWVTQERRSGHWTNFMNALARRGISTDTWAAQKKV
ncbi:hypothetical protein BDV95DRAFT_572747 [Massariosphaeria phaeospora]|uniref:Uncharacterized protein n=1 Tax=Massariosphaeria phaeospora TaxID=100035 RepID=A0A7C8MA43_9PLEO|nr:hypothetical protein BDV95DRAFT_572747 [Massariosphaeria phaeospora]